MAFKSTDSSTGGSDGEATNDTSTSSSTTSSSTSQPLDDLQREIDENERKAQETTDSSNETDYATTPAPDTSTPAGGSPDTGGAAGAPTNDADSGAVPETSTPGGGSPDGGGIAGPVGSGETRDPSNRSPSAKERARRDDDSGAGAGGAGGGAGSGFSQGVETGSGRVAEQARELEREVLAQYGALGASDVAVRERGDRLVATVSDAGRRRVVSDALASPGAGNKAAAVRRARSRARESAFGSLPAGFVTGKQKAVSQQQAREEARDFSAAVGDVQVTGDDGGAGQAVRRVRGREARNEFSRASSPREMRVATAMAYDEAVARANQEYKERKTDAFVSTREAEAGEIIDYDWSTFTDAAEAATGLDVPLGGDPDTDEVEQYVRRAERKWETEGIGFGPLYQSNTSVRDIREGFGSELAGAQQASQSYAQSQGMTNAEYGMTQLMGPPVASQGPTYVSRTGANTLGVVPSTLPINLPGAAQGGMELVEAAAGSLREREQAQDEALDAITSGEPGTLSENPQAYRDLAIQAATGLPTADTESARTLREGGRYTANVAMEAAAYAAKNPNQAITGGALIAGQSLVGGAALARAPAAARRAASAAPTDRIRSFPYGGGMDRGMARLTGPDGDSGSGKTVITGDDLNNRGFGMPDNPQPRRDAGGVRRSRQGPGVGPRAYESPGPNPRAGGESMSLGYRSASTELGENYLDAQRVATMDYDEFARANAMAGRSAGAASGVAGALTSGSRRRREAAQAPQVTLDDAVSGREEDLGYAAGVYGGTVAGGMQLYREDPATIADTTQLFSDRVSDRVEPAQESGVDTATGIDTDVSVAQAPLSGRDQDTPTDTDTDTVPVTRTDVGTTPAQDTPQAQTPDQPTLVTTPTPTPNTPFPRNPGLRFPWSPRRTPNPDTGDESPDARPRPKPESRRPSVEFEGPGRATNPINELAVAMAFGLSAGPRRLPDRSAAGPEYDDQFGTPTAVEVSGTEAEQEAIEAAKARLSGLQIDPSVFFGDDSGTSSNTGDSDANTGGGFDWF